MTLSTIGAKIGPVSTKVPGFETVISATTLVTHTPKTAPPLNLLIVPGGLGNTLLGNDTWIEDFVASRFASTDIVASVCTGASSLVKSGVLKRKNATTNKAAWSSVTGLPGAEKVNWQPNARWTHDGKIWTSSGVAAGMDMTYALLRWMYGDQAVNDTMNSVGKSPRCKGASLKSFQKRMNFCIFFILSIKQADFILIEYAPHVHQSWDPFAVVHKVSG